MVVYRSLIFVMQYRTEIVILKNWYLIEMLSICGTLLLSLPGFPHKPPSTIHCWSILWYYPIPTRHPITRLQRARMTNWRAKCSRRASCFVVLVPSTRTAIPWDDRAQFGSNCWRCVAKNIRNTRTRNRAHLQGTARCETAKLFVKSEENGK